MKITGPMRPKKTYAVPFALLCPRRGPGTHPNPDLCARSPKFEQVPLHSRTDAKSGILQNGSLSVARNYLMFQAHLLIQPIVYHSI